MHPLAEELNTTIQKENPLVYRLLSERGKRLFFPRGILSQSQEAKQKATTADATIGIATDGAKPLYLECIHKHFKDMDPAELYPYAPSTGKKELRDAWLEKIRSENPQTEEKTMSLPVVTNGLTQALATVGDLFLDAGDVILIPDKYWGNYNLIYKVRQEVAFSTYPLYAPEGGFNVAGLQKALEDRPPDSKTMVLLNFPNNPTGYSPTQREAEQIAATIIEAAEERDLLIVTDDAYFGLFYEDACLAESLFGWLCNSSDRILAVKADAATKEEFVWGFRCGFLTFGLKNHCEAVYRALEKKTGGAIRGSISNVSHVSQSLVLKALQDPNFRDEQQKARAVLRERAQKVKTVVYRDEFSGLWTVYPFNAGYFMCLGLKETNAEKLRVHLLDNYGIGTISTGEKDLRIAFSSLTLEQIEPFFETIATGIKDLQGAG